MIGELYNVLNMKNWTRLLFESCVRASLGGKNWIKNWVLDFILGPVLEPKVFFVTFWKLKIWWNSLFLPRFFFFEYFVSFWNMEGLRESVETMIWASLLLSTAQSCHLSTSKIKFNDVLKWQDYAVDDKRDAHIRVLCSNIWSNIWRFKQTKIELKNEFQTSYKNTHWYPIWESFVYSAKLTISS